MLTMHAKQHGSCLSQVLVMPSRALVPQCLSGILTDVNCYGQDSVHNATKLHVAPDACEKCELWCFFNVWIRLCKKH